MNRRHAATKTTARRREHYEEAMAVVKRHYGRVPLKWYLMLPLCVLGVVMNADLQARLEPMARVIAQQLARKPEHFITHPSEKMLFRSLSDEDLRAFASAHGWRVVKRLGGRRMERAGARTVARQIARSNIATMV